MPERPGLKTLATTPNAAPAVLRRNPGAAVSDSIQIVETGERETNFLLRCLDNLIVSACLTEPRFRRYFGLDRVRMPS